MTVQHADKTLTRSTPEAVGIASSGILAFLDATAEHVRELHSFMLLRHGKIAAEGWWAPYEPGKPHMLFSLSKSFTSTAAGLAISEGLLSLDDTVISFFPDEAPAQISDHLAAMQVRHLLSMSTGHAEDTLGALSRTPDSNWVQLFLARPVEYTPGTHFLYNSGATYMVSAIVQKLTGQRVIDYLGPRLFEPLGITDPKWEVCPRGINTGGWGLSVRTGDIARFGQLYLQKGVWEGRRLLPESWVEEATSKQVSNGDDPNNDWTQGYGYQFWRCRHGAYRGDGAFGQFCIVIPDQDAVIAITAGVADMGGVLNLVWKHLLPAMQAAPLPEDADSREKLRERLARLRILRPEGRPTSPLEHQMTGKNFYFEPNDQKIDTVTLDFDTNACTLKIRNFRGEQKIVCGRSGAWPRSEAVIDSLEPRPVAAEGAWAEDDTYVAKLCFYETPFCPIINCRFKDGQMSFTYQQNVSFGPTQRPPLVGTTR